MDRQYKISLFSWYLLRCSATLMLLVALPAAAQALPGTEKSDRLAGLANETEQVAYCYYTTTVNTQFAKFSPNKSAASDSAAAAAQWQTFYLAAAAKDPALIQASSHIMQYFNQLVSRYRQENSANKFSAMAAIASQDRPFCQALLEKMNRMQIADKKSAAAASAAVVKKAPAPPANPWRKLDFSGSWQASELQSQFSFIDRIQLVLWDSGHGTAEGLVLFIKDRQQCLGAVESKGDLSVLQITSIEGGYCREALDNGYFQLVSEAQNTALKLAFIPGHLSSYQQEQYVKQGTLQLQKMPKTSANLQAYAQHLKPNSLSMQERLAQYKKEQNNPVKRLRKTLANGFKDHYNDARLIGSWQGKIYDKSRAYQAEMVVWSSKPQRLQQLVGVLRFDNKLCDMAFLIGATKDYVQIYINSALSKRSAQPCTIVNGDGSVRFNEATDTMAIFTTVNPGMLDGFGGKQCLSDLVSNEMGDCFYAGLFKRKPASAKMKQTINQFAWGVVKAPSPKTWQVLQNNTADLVQLQTQHLQATEKNPQILAQVLEEDKQRRRRYDEAFEKQKQQRREENAKRSYTRSAASSAGNQSRQSVFDSPVISGPFDGLRGASFFNAVYQGDAKSVRQITRAYQEKKIRRRKEVMGNKPHIMDGILDSSVRKIRLTSIFLAVYLLNYDTVYKSCLKDDAAKFVVTRETPDTVSYNMMGWEVSRSYGHVDKKYYTVNKEFTDAFRRVGKMRPESASMWNGIENMMTNNSKPDMLADVMAGTRQMMAEFKCDDKKIKQLERNILSITATKNSP